MEWEYRVVHGGLNDGSAGERTLNEYGMDGWELVTETLLSPKDPRYGDRRWVFKRRVPQVHKLDRKTRDDSEQVLKDKGWIPNLNDSPDVLTKEF